MSRVSDESHTLPPQDDGDATLADLRRQLEAVKRRMEEHRLQMRAAGLAPNEAPEPPAG